MRTRKTTRMRQSKKEPGIVTNNHSSNQEKLRNKIQDLKHRLCLLEYTLGMVATVLMDNFKMDGSLKPNIEERTEEDEDEKQIYKGTIQCIGELLAKTENCLKAGAPNVNKLKSGTRNIRTVTPPQQKFEAIGSPIAPSGDKPRIFIDEMDFGRNTLSGYCNIQIVENSTFFSFADPSLEALSTLAEVATQAGKKQDFLDYVPLKKRRLFIGGN